MSDIAERAGVSRPTVSVVLNERHNAIGIADDTRRKVLAVAEELGYRRNELARAVKTGKSRTFGFLAGAAHLEYSARFFSGMLDEAEDRGFSVQRFRLGENQDRKAIARCVEHRLAGVVVHDPDATLPFETMRREFDQHNVPAVLLDTKKPGDWGVQVAADEADGAAQAVRYLVDLGHQNIVFLGGVENTGSAIPRLAGYRAAMEEAGFKKRTRAVWTDWILEVEETRLRDLMRENDPPTAILCGSDAQALIALRTLRWMGKSVPHDVSVIGYGNLSRVEFADPPLTTVAVPYEEMGRQAVRLLMQIPGEETLLHAPSHHKFATRLVIRHSTAPAPR